MPVKKGWHDLVKSLLDAGVPLQQDGEVFNMALTNQDLPMLSLLLQYHVKPVSSNLQIAIALKRFGY